MRYRSLASLSVVAGAAALAAIAAISLSGQSPATNTKKAAPKSPVAKSAAPETKSAVPRTSWGVPDLQGTWYVEADVPLQRSAANAGKEFLTDEEIAASDKKKGLDPGRNARSANKEADVTGAYNAVFNSVLRTGRRTSMIIDPPDGKIPPLVADAQGRGGRGGRGGNPGMNPLDNPETTGQAPGGSAMTRCLGVTLPFLPLNTLFAQGTVMQIVQSPKSLGIYMEDDHSGGGNMVVYMDGRPHLPSNIKQYLGDSRGHWEGNTLVIETTNFSQATNFFGVRGPNPDSFKMTERMTRVDANTLDRRITFDDPQTWTRPWTVLIEMGRAPSDRQMIFDSACHEGNYAMIGMLVGARREEQAAAKAAPKK